MGLSPYLLQIYLNSLNKAKIRPVCASSIPAIHIFRSALVSASASRSSRFVTNCFSIISLKNGRKLTRCPIVHFSGFQTVIDIERIYPPPSFLSTVCNIPPFLRYTTSTGVSTRFMVVNVITEPSFFFAVTLMSARGFMLLS